MKSLSLLSTCCPEVRHNLGFSSGAVEWSNAKDPRLCRAARRRECMQLNLNIKQGLKGQWCTVHFPKTNKLNKIRFKKRTKKKDILKKSMSFFGGENLVRQKAINAGRQITKVSNIIFFSLQLCVFIISNNKQKVCIFETNLKEM